MSIHMNSRNGSFGFQVFGGVDVGCAPEIELVVPGRLIGCPVFPKVLDTGVVQCRLVGAI